MTKYDVALIDAMRSLYDGTGLAGIASPWAASAALHLIATVMAVMVAKLQTRLAPRLKAKPHGPAHWVSMVVFVGLMSVLMFVVVTLQSFITNSLTGRLARGLAYESFSLSLFGLMAASYFVVLWHGKFFVGWSGRDEK